IHPGASAPSRRYPPESFAEVASHLGKKQIQILFTGAPEEKKTVEWIAKQSAARTLSLAGALSLDELAGAIALSPLLVTNNTGPAHMAAAVGTPVVDLYALTNPQHTPWGVEHRVLY